MIKNTNIYLQTLALMIMMIMSAGGAWGQTTDDVIISWSDMATSGYDANKKGTATFKTGGASASEYIDTGNGVVNNLSANLNSNNNYTFNSETLTLYRYSTTKSGDNGLTESDENYFKYLYNITTGCSFTPTSIKIAWAPDGGSAIKLQVKAELANGTLTQLKELGNTDKTYSVAELTGADLSAVSDWSTVVGLRLYVTFTNPSTKKSVVLNEVTIEGTLTRIEEKTVSSWTLNVNPISIIPGQQNTNTKDATATVTCSDNSTVTLNKSDMALTIADNQVADLFNNDRVVIGYKTGTTKLVATVPASIIKGDIKYNFPDNLRSKTVSVTVSEQEAITAVTNKMKWWFGSSYNASKNDNNNTYITTSGEGKRTVSSTIDGSTNKTLVWYGGNGVEIYGTKLYNRGGFYQVRTSGKGQLKIRLKSVGGLGENRDVGNPREFRVRTISGTNAYTERLGFQLDDVYSINYTTDEERLTTYSDPHESAGHHHNIEYIVWVPEGLENSALDFVSFNHSDVFPSSSNVLSYLAAPTEAGQSYAITPTTVKRSGPVVTMSAVQSSPVAESGRAGLTYSTPSTVTVPAAGGTNYYYLKVADGESRDYYELVVKTSTALTGRVVEVEDVNCDYSRYTWTGYTGDGFYTPTQENNQLKFTNTAWYQFFVKELIPTTTDTHYKLTAKIKGSTAGNFGVQFGEWSPGRVTRQLPVTTAETEQTVNVYTPGTYDKSFVIFQPTANVNYEMSSFKMTHEAQAGDLTALNQIKIEGFDISSKAPYTGSVIEAHSTQPSGTYTITIPAKQSYALVTLYDENWNWKVNGTGNGNNKLTYASIEQPAEGQSKTYYITVQADDGNGRKNIETYTFIIYHDVEAATTITSNNTAVTRNASGQYVLSAATAGQSVPVSVTLSVSGMTAQLSQQLEDLSVTPNYGSTGITQSGISVTLSLTAPAAGQTCYYKLKITRPSSSSAPSRAPATEIGDVYVFAVTTEDPLVTLTGYKKWELNTGNSAFSSIVYGDYTDPKDNNNVTKNVVFPATGLFDNNTLRIYANGSDRFYFDSERLNFFGSGAKGSGRCIEFVVNKTGIVKLSGKSNGASNTRGFYVASSVDGVLSGSDLGSDNLLDFSNFSGERSFAVNVTDDNPVHIFIYSKNGVSMFQLEWIPSCTELTYPINDGDWVYPGQRIELENNNGKKTTWAKYGSGTNDVVSLPVTYAVAEGSENYLQIYGQKYLIPINPTTGTEDDAVFTISMPETVTVGDDIYDLTLTPGYEPTKEIHLTVNGNDKRGDYDSGTQTFINELVTISKKTKFWFGSTGTSNSTTTSADIYIPSVADNEKYSRKKYGIGTDNYLEVLWWADKPDASVTDRICSRGEYYKLVTSGPGTLKIKMGTVNPDAPYGGADADRTFYVVPATSDGLSTLTVGEHKEYLLRYTDNAERIITLINPGYHYHNIYYIEWVPLKVERVDLHNPGDMSLAVGETSQPVPLPTVYFNDGTSADATLTTPLLASGSESIVEVDNTGRALTAKALGTSMITMQLTGATAAHSSGKSFSLDDVDLENNTFTVTVVEEGTGHRIWKFGVGSSENKKETDGNKTVYTIYKPIANGYTANIIGGLSSYQTRESPIITDVNGEIALLSRSDYNNYDNFKINVKQSGTFRVIFAPVDSKTPTIPGSVPRSGYTYKPGADDDPEVEGVKKPQILEDVNQRTVLEKHFTLTEAEQATGKAISFVQSLSSTYRLTYSLIYSIEWIPDGEIYIESTEVASTNDDFKTYGIVREYPANADENSTTTNQPQTSDINYLLNTANPKIVTANATLAKTENKTTTTYPDKPLTYDQLEWRFTDNRISLDNDGHIVVNHAVAKWCDFETTIHLDVKPADFITIDGTKYVLPNNRTYLSIPFKVKYPVRVLGADFSDILDANGTSVSLVQTKTLTLPTEVTIRLSNGEREVVTNPSFTITEGDTYASLADGVVTGIDVGTATVTMASTTVKIGNETYTVPEQSFTLNVVAPKTATLKNKAPATISMAVGDKYTIPFPTLELPDGTEITLDFTNTTFVRSHTTEGYLSGVTSDGVVTAAKTGNPHVDITYTSFVITAPDGEPYRYNTVKATMNVRVVSPTAVITDENNKTTKLKPITKDSQFRVGVIPYPSGFIEEGYVWNTGIGRPDQNRGATITSLPNPLAGAQIDQNKAVGFMVEPPAGMKAFIRVYAITDKGGVKLLQGGNFGDAKANNTPVASASSGSNNAVVTLKYEVKDASTYWIYNSSGKATYLLGFDIGFYKDARFHHGTSATSANTAMTPANTIDNPLVLSPDDDLSKLAFKASTGFGVGDYTAQVQKQAGGSYLNIPTLNRSISYSATTNNDFSVASSGNITLKKAFAGTKPVKVTLEGGSFTYNDRTTFFPTMETYVYFKLKDGSKVCALSAIADKTMYSDNDLVATANKPTPSSDGLFYVLDIGSLCVLKDQNTGAQITAADYDLDISWNNVASYNCTTTQLQNFRDNAKIVDRKLYIKKANFAEVTLNIKLTAWPTATNDDDEHIYFPATTSFKLKCMPYFEFNQQNVRFNVTTVAKEIVREGDSTTDFNGTVHNYTATKNSDNSEKYPRCDSGATGGTETNPYTHYYYIPSSYPAKVSVYVPYYSKDTYVIKYKFSTGATDNDKKDWTDYDVGSGITGDAVASTGKDNFEKVLDISVAKNDGTDDGGKPETTYYRLKFNYINAPSITIVHYKDAACTTGQEGAALPTDSKGNITDYVHTDCVAAKVTFTKSSTYNATADKLYFTKDTSIPAWDYSAVTSSSNGSPVASTLELTSSIMTGAGGASSFTSGSWYFTTQRNNQYYIAQFPKLDNFYTGDWEIETTSGKNKKVKKIVSNIFPLISQPEMVALPEKNMKYVKAGDKLTVGMVRELSEELGSKTFHTLHAVYGKSGVWYKNNVGTDFEQGIFKWNDANHADFIGSNTLGYMDAYQYSTEVSGSYGNPVAEVSSNIGADGSEAGGRFQAPVSGAFIRLEPEYDGVVTAWMRVNGAAENNMVEGGTNAGLLRRRPVYIMDENGIIMPRTTIKTTADNYFCANGTVCLLPGHAEFRGTFERAWQYGTEHPAVIAASGTNLELYYLYAHNYDWLNLNFDSDDYNADPVNRYRLFSNPIYGSDKLARTKIQWMTAGGKVIKPDEIDASTDRYYLDGFARYGYEIPNFYYARFRFPVKAGKTYFLGGRVTKNGINAVKFEPLRVNYKTKTFRNQTDNPTLNDDGTTTPASASDCENTSVGGLVAGEGGRDVNKVYYSYGEETTLTTAEKAGIETIKTYIIDESGDGLSDQPTGADGKLSTVSIGSSDNAQLGHTCNIKLKRTFTAGKWHPIVLPFSVSETRMKQIFGDDVMVLYLDPDQEHQNEYAMKTVEKPAVGKMGDKLLLNFTCHYYQMLYANMPAFICPTFKWYEKDENGEEYVLGSDGKRSEVTTTEYTNRGAELVTKDDDDNPVTPYKEDITFERVTYIGNREERRYKPTSYTKGTDVDADEHGVYVDILSDKRISVDTYGYSVPSEGTEDDYIGYPIGNGYRVVGSYKKNDNPTGEMYYLDNIDKGNGKFEAHIKRATAGVKMKGTRVWIEEDPTYGTTSPAPLAMVGMRNFNESADMPTSGIVLADEIYDDPVPEELQHVAAHDPHVYNLQGMVMGCVDKDTTFESIRRRLPAGVYIFQGKKVVKR